MHIALHARKRDKCVYRLTLNKKNTKYLYSVSSINRPLRWYLLIGFFRQLLLLLTISCRVNLCQVIDHLSHKKRIRKCFHIRSSIESVVSFAPANQKTSENQMYTKSVIITAHNRHTIFASHTLKKRTFWQSFCSFHLTQCD